jgi:hypothetical protein
MNRITVLTHEFVEFIPDNLKEGALYVSVTYATLAHKCCCGCGNEVITPLSPTDWKLIFDGQSISLEPSIGNWNFACQSHYWIKRNRVRWAPRWSLEEINAGRAYDELAKGRYFDSTKTPTIHDAIATFGGPGESKLKDSLWRKLKKLWFSLVAVMT